MRKHVAPQRSASGTRWPRVAKSQVSCAAWPANSPAASLPDARGTWSSDKEGSVGSKWDGGPHNRNPVLAAH
eukprot:3674439-Pyramimonas_sp.AAC.1